MDIFEIFLTSLFRIFRIFEYFQSLRILQTWPRGRVPCACACVTHNTRPTTTWGVCFACSCLLLWPSVSLLKELRMQQGSPMILCMIPQSPLGLLFSWRLSMMIIGHQLGLPPLIPNTQVCFMPSILKFSSSKIQK